MHCTSELELGQYQAGVSAASALELSIAQGMHGSCSCCQLPRVGPAAASLKAVACSCAKAFVACNGPSEMVLKLP